MAFDWEQLGQYKLAGAFLHGYPSNIRRFFAPDDQVHDVLVALIKSATISLDAAFYGWDDDELDQLFRDAWEKENLPVTICLDKSQAAGKHERDILAKWPQSQIGNTLLIGTSRFHAINHLKMVVVDGLVTIGGSTNWSAGGEAKQNNELLLVNDPVYSAESSAKIRLVADEMRMQMLKGGLGHVLAGDKPS